MNILIVDDEPLIHRSIEFMIRELNGRDRQNMNLFHAQNALGMEVLLREHKIDLALVDIKMPGANGLSAITQAKTFSPDTLYFIMSGYSEFDYARKAITIGVEDYLLKPLDSSTLQRAISATEERQHILLECHRDVLRYWLRDIAAKRECTDRLPEGEILAAIYLAVDSHDCVKSGLVPDLHSRFGSNIVSCATEDGILALVFSPRRESVEAMLSAAKNMVFPEETTMCITPVCADPLVLKNILLKILDGFCIRVLLGIGQQHSAEEIINFQEKSLLKYAESCLLWRNCYDSGSWLEYLSACMAVCGPMESGSIPEAYRSNVLQFIGTVLGIQTKKPLSPHTLRSVLESAGNMMIQRQDITDRMDSLVRYINENFCSDLSIASLSEHFGLTPNYLSTILNQKLKVKFADYLAGLRIGYAKKLLSGTEMPVKDIMEKVGYYSPSHFNKLFVKMEGVTPSAYRKAGGEEKEKS